VDSSPDFMIGLCPLQVGEDPRPVMRAAYRAFQDGKDPERILAAVDPARGSHDTFYAHLVCSALPQLSWLSIQLRCRV
jgi:hypothetical protein